jgi:hypothetical protein
MERESKLKIFKRACNDNSRARALLNAAALRVSHTASQHMQASWDAHGRTENERRNMAGSVRSSSSAAGHDTRSPDGGDGSWHRPDSSRPTDIEALMIRQPQQLLRLDLSSCGLSSLAQFRAGLAALRRLRHLDISKNAITSLRPVRALPSLESIICSSNSLKVLDGLDECPQLTRITAADNMIASLGDLRALLRLRTLGLRGNQLSSVAALPHHLPTGLHELDLANNELGNLSDLRYVSSLMELRRLDLRANPLASMAHMQVFCVHAAGMPLVGSFAAPLPKQFHIPCAGRQAACLSSPQCSWF